MPTNLVGFLGAFDEGNAIRNEITSVAINWYINRVPLITRIRRNPVGSVTFNIVNRKYRPRTFTLSVAVSTTGQTTFTFSDGTALMQGDVLELVKQDGSAKERVEVTTDPVSNAVTVKRAAEGTTATTNDLSANATMTLIGNSRTGAEVNQSATSFLPLTVAQYCQTFQHPIQLGGSLLSSSAFVGAPDGGSPLSQSQMEALQNLMDDMEVSSYYGIGEAPASGSRPKQKGLKTQITTNKVTAPTNAGAYKPSDLIRDTTQACAKNGGNPDVIFMSSDWIQGLSIWGAPAQRISAGTNVFGIPIDTFETPLLTGKSLIFAPLLSPGTAFCINSNEVVWRNKRNEFYNPHGNRGDAVEADFIAEGALEVDNEYHHAWVEGVTAFSAT